MARLNATFENALVSWVETALTLTNKVVWDKQDAPRPALPYVTLNLLPPIDETGIHAERVYKDDDTFTIKYRFVVGVSVNIISNSDYFKKMNDLTVSLDKSSVRDALKTAGLYYRYSDNSIDLTGLLDSSYEFRVQKDFHFAYTTESDDEAGEIRRVIAAIDFGNSIEADIDEQSPDF